MVYYKFMKSTINAHNLAKVIRDIIMHHHGVLNLIMTNKDFFFSLKF